MGQETVVRRIKNLPADTPPGIRLADLLCWNEINAIPPPLGMMMDPYAEAHARKGQIRKEAGARRRRQVDAEAVSRRILQRLVSQSEYSRSRTILFYVSFRSEVGVHESLSAAAAAGKRVVVPYCVGNRLELFRLESLEELASGTMGILEPKVDLRWDQPTGVAARNSI